MPGFVRRGLSHGLTLPVASDDDLQGRSRISRRCNASFSRQRLLQIGEMTLQRLGIVVRNGSQSLSERFDDRRLLGNSVELLWSMARTTVEGQTQCGVEPLESILHLARCLRNHLLVNRPKRPGDLARSRNQASRRKRSHTKCEESRGPRLDLRCDQVFPAERESCQLGPG